MTILCNDVKPDGFHPREMPWQTFFPQLPSGAACLWVFQLQLYLQYAKSMLENALKETVVVQQGDHVGIRLVCLAL